MLLLLPTVGCANPFANLKPKMPWSASGIQQTQQDTTFAAAKPPTFQMAGYQLQGKEVVTPAVGVADELVGGAGQADVELPMPVDAAILPPLPAE